MRIRHGLVALAVALLAVWLSPNLAPRVGATPPNGVTGTQLAKGTFDAFQVKVKTGDWKLQLKTNEPSDLFVLENRFDPGGTFGWHSHPGPSLVIVKSGTLSLYQVIRSEGDDEGDDETDGVARCAVRRIGAGSGFVDTGGDVHMVRNETMSEVVVLVASLVPEGATRRIDQPAPRECPPDVR